MPTAVVTGANRGMGLEFTRQLLESGHHVFATARGKKADALDALGRAHPDQLTRLSLDVGDTGSIATFAAELTTRTDHVDLLVNNAGINSRTMPKGQKNVRFGDLEPEGLQRMVAVNAIGPVLLVQALLPLLQASQTAKVVSVSSWLASIGNKSSGGNYGYCASKTMLNMLARMMAFDLKPHGITSVVINPGWVQTDMGGDQAPLTAETSVAGMLSVAAGLGIDDAGRFMVWDGTEQPW